MVLCLAMMLSIMVVGAGAAFADQSDIDTKHTEAVDMCNALNIITGFENGKFMPKDNVTREQTAKMICVLLNGGKEPQLATGSTFTDVPADRWSNKYIEACASRGVVVGVGGGKFAPAGKVTATQAAKMLLVELGYDDDLQQYSGSNWATKVNVDATKKGYYKDLEDIDVNAPLTREHAAQMIWNALQANEVGYNYTLVTNPDGSISSKVDVGDKDQTLMEDKYGAVVLEGTLAGFEYSSKDAEWTYYVIPAGYESEYSDSSLDRGPFCAFTSATDFTDLLAQNVKVVVKDVEYDANATRPYYYEGVSPLLYALATKSHDAYGIFAEDSVVLFSGLVGDLPNLKDADTDLKFDDVKYKFDDSYVNGVEAYFFVYNENVLASGMYDNDGDDAYLNLNDIAGKDGNDNVKAWDAYQFDAIDKDGDGKIDFVLVHPYIVAKVSYCSSTDIKLNPTLVRAQAPAAFFGLTGITDKLEIGDDVIAYDGIAKNDYVVWTPEDFTKDGTATVVKVDDIINGKVTMNDDPDFTVDGTAYIADASYGDAPSVGSILTDGIIVNGYMFDVDSTSKKDIKDYAVVVGIAGASDNGMDGNRAKLLFADNTKKSVDLAGNYAYNQTSNPTGIKVGDLVTFKINSDGEYKLNKAPETLDKSGYDLFGSNGSNTAVAVKQISNSSDNAGYISGYYKDGNSYNLNNANITSDSVIFVKYKGDSYKAITGDQLKKIKYSDFDDEFANRYVLGTKQSKGTNVYDVNLAYISTDGNTDIKDADTYGNTE